jgi:hypothetical protein
VETCGLPSSPRKSSRMGCPDFRFTIQAEAGGPLRNPGTEGEA